MRNPISSNANNIRPGSPGCAFLVRCLDFIGISLYETSKLQLVSVAKQNGPRGYETFFMLNSAEHEILTAHEY